MIYEYKITFSSKVVRLKELNEFNRGEMLRGFVDFMKEQGLKNDFLVEETQILAANSQNNVPPGSFYEVK